MGRDVKIFSLEKRKLEGELIVLDVPKTYVTTMTYSVLLYWTQLTNR